MARLLTLDDLDRDALAGSRVLLRVDFNVPLDGERVTDDTRLREALPTLRELADAGARLLLCSHLGRPQGAPDPRCSLRPVAHRLGELLARPVAFADDCVGPPARRAADALGRGGVALLENLRFHAGETSDDDAFADALAALADAYVNDAFGAAHRAHASVVGVPRRLARRAAGRLLVREVETLGRLLHGAQEPFVAVVGGAKITGKIDTLDHLLGLVDAVLLGGGMANTFLAAQGRDLGGSLFEPDKVDLAGQLLEKAVARGVRVELPSDLVVADSVAEPGAVTTVEVASGVPGQRMALDIGNTTRSRFTTLISGAGTVFWNGPMGVFEKPPFDAGTRAVAEAVAACGGFTVIGGGETVAAVRRAGVADRIDHVSTGGGASLELLAGMTLPGVAALEAS
ncbi:MAG TPA: phosphoglycerate kinase [Thermoanaerobaculia bacterium]|nr:phosphoglycerate kinase [Thermoanaerobaculia bacterium]